MLTTDIKSAYKSVVLNDEYLSVSRTLPASGKGGLLAQEYTKAIYFGLNKLM